MLKSYSLQIIGTEGEEIHSWVIEKCSVKSYQKMSPNETDIYIYAQETHKLSNIEDQERNFP